MKLIFSQTLFSYDCYDKLYAKPDIDTSKVLSYSLASLFPVTMQALSHGDILKEMLELPKVLEAECDNLKTYS